MVCAGLVAHMGERGLVVTPEVDHLEDVGVDEVKLSVSMP
jgi:hypothetical protein